MTKKYLTIEKPRLRARVRAQASAGSEPERHKSSSGAQERELQKQPKAGSRTRRSGSTPRPAPRPSAAETVPKSRPPASRRPKDPLERLIQPEPPRNTRKSELEPGDMRLLDVEQLQRQIDENASVYVGRFEGPGTCPHCRQSVHRPWNIQLGNPPINLLFCNAGIAELKWALQQIQDPRKG